MQIDLSLSNVVLWNGCEIEQVGGRLNLKTPPKEAGNILGRNLNLAIGAEPSRDEVTLTGPMAVWAYLVAFHAVVHCFRRVYYHDGKGEPLLVAAHG